MKILICDDEEAYLGTLAEHIRSYMENRSIPCEITAAASPTSVAESTDAFDLAFLDIQMEPMDGISLAKELKKRNRKLAVFFVTNYDEYQDDAMDLGAFRFFEKPFDVKRLYSGLDKAMEYIDGAYIDFYLSGYHAQQRLIADDILYITRDGRKTALKTAAREYCVSEKYDDLCSRLPQLFFCPVHKSYYVNLHYVDRYAYTELQLTDGTRIPIAPRRQSAFHKFWFEYLRRR